MNTQDANNILSLSTCSQRFTLLPIAKSLSSTTSTNSTLLTKGNLFKANLGRDEEHQVNHEHFDQDSNSTNIENLGIENRVSIRPSILAPSKKGRYEVLEVLGYIYKADYRMRFTYARLGKTCILMGQEILEMSNPF